MESQIGCPDPHPGKRLASDAAPDQNFWSADISQKFLQNKKTGTNVLKKFLAVGDSPRVTQRIISSRLLNHPPLEISHRQTPNGHWRDVRSWG
jgi:hypothetical protein